MMRSLFVVSISWLLASTALMTIATAQTRSKPISATVAASIEGTVIDAATSQPVAGALILAKNSAGTIKAQQRVGSDGAYRLVLDDAKQVYTLTTNASGYEPHEEQVAFTTSYSTQLSKKAIRIYRSGTKPAPAPTTTSTESKAPTAPTSATTVAQRTPTAATTPTSPPSAPPVTSAGPRLTPPKTLDAKVIYTPPLTVAPAGQTTQLRAIQFVQSKAELLPDAQPALEQLLAFMQSNATAEILLAGHTDNQGNFDENLRLSQQRVDAVKAYLVQNGIPANRITARGYGPTRPIASNNYENTRQQNRRVELIVLKP